MTSMPDPALDALLNRYRVMVEGYANDNNQMRLQGAHATFAMLQDARAAIVAHVARLKEQNAKMREALRDLVALTNAVMRELENGRDPDGELADASLREQRDALRAALQPFAAVDECGFGILVGTDDEHSERCRECREILFARRVLAATDPAKEPTA